MQRFIVLLACVLCLAAPKLTAASEVVSCVVLPKYYSPGYTYKIEKTEDALACSVKCAYDYDRIVWSHEKYSGLCALKNDTQVFIGAVDVVSGVKYIGHAVPVLEKNYIHAYIVDQNGKTVVVKPVAPRPNVVSVSASASSTGGRAVSRASASPHGVSTFNSVSGAGHASTRVETPKISLATSLTKEHYKPPQYLVKYYKKPSIVAQVTTVKGKIVPVLVAEDKEITCYRCSDFPCFMKKTLSFKYYGYVYATLPTDSDKQCCHECKKAKECHSWWRHSVTKKCVLNYNVPKPTVDYYVTGGTVL